MKLCVRERGLSFISHSLSRRFWGIASTFWHPDLLNSGKSQALAFPCCLNSVLPFREKIAVDLSPCHRGRVRVHSRNWDHGSHLLAELDLDLKLHTHAIFRRLFLCFLRHRSKLLSPFLGDFMVTVCLVVRVLGTGILPKATEAVGCSSSWAYVRVVQAVLSCRLRECSSLGLKLNAF